VKIIDKHIIKEFIPPFLYCLGMFICLYIVIDLFANLEDIIKQNVKFLILLQYYFAFFPIIVTQITPMALLLSVLYTMGTLNCNNEITALKASGISIWRIILPLLFLGLVVVILSFVLENKIVPKSYRLYSQIKEEKIKSTKKKNQKEIIKDVTLYGENYRIYYAESYHVKDKILYSVIILQNDEKGNLIARITADRAEWVKDKWILKNCAIHRLDKEGVATGEPLVFKEKKLKIPEKPCDFKRSKYQTAFISIFKLYKYIKKLSNNGYQPASLLVDFYNKLSFPFINLIVVLIGVSFALLPNKGGALMYLGVALGVGLIYYAAIITSTALGKEGFIPPLLSSWLANIIFAIIGVVLIIKLPK